MTEEELDSVQETQSDQAAGDDAAAMQFRFMQALLQDARNKADSHWDQCLRLQADIDNLRKRNERDLVNATKLPWKSSQWTCCRLRTAWTWPLQRPGRMLMWPGLKEGGELTLKMLTSVMDKYNINQINALNEKF